MRFTGLLKSLAKLHPVTGITSEVIQTVADIFGENAETVEEALAHDPADDGIDFGEAIEALKAGKMIAREGWNSKGMFVFKQVPSAIPPAVVENMTSLPSSVKRVLIERNQGPNYCNQMAIVKADGSVDSWVASSSDTFAEDWVIVE